MKFMSDVCRSAVQTVITFTRDCDTQFFTFHQANVVNNFLANEVKDREEGANIRGMFTRPFLNIFEYEKGKVEVNNVVNKFKWYQRMMFKEQEVRVRTRLRR